jgi:DNA-directed RNA polymerase
MAVKNPFLLAFTDRRKQRQGIAPNFVHSMDATHMLMTGSECVAEGITFASVHDSFWSHASNIDRMSVILREQFVKLYNRDVSGDLWTQLAERYDGFMRLVKIDRTSDAAKKILDLRKGYKFSNQNENETLRYELEQEFYKWKATKNVGSSTDAVITAVPSDTATKNEEFPVETKFATVPTDILKEHPTKYFPLVGSTASNGVHEEDDLEVDGLPADRAALRVHAGGEHLSRKSYIKVLVPVEISKPPMRGIFDVKSVLTSPYFFA